MSRFLPSLKAQLNSATVLALAFSAGLALSLPAPVHAFGAPESFAELADKISPSVVNITTSAVVSGPMGGGPMVPEGSPFEDFFNEFGNPATRARSAARRWDPVSSSRKTATS